ncbi:MAG TPA: hypothetical protein VG370_19750 [Chloroflexota bacterium]|jgi:plastocyanin|nr:hypothetical protein [Chloroflexota bacterium]
MRKSARLLAAAFVAAALASPSAVGATPDGTATVRFGNPEAGSPFPPPSGHDQSSNAKDNLIPRTVVISSGGSVTFEIDGFHQPAVYQAGTSPEDIAVPSTGLFVNDANGRLALAPLNRPPATSSFPMTFAEPGTYLVICNVRPHFALFNMYGWVVVK